MYLVLDIGTSDLKCACLDSQYNVVTQYKSAFPMEEYGCNYEIDFELFFDRTSDLLSKCLSDKKVRCSKVEALLVTSQAQTFTSVNVDFQPLCRGIVWLDERAIREAKLLNEQLPDFSQTAGFNRPLPSLYVSKLLWLKQNEPDIFKEAKAFPLINEYLVHRLTGEFYSDSTSFGMSGIYDFRENVINKKIMQILDLTEDSFPEIESAVMRGELISQNIQREWKLNYRFPVFLCGNDQGASACGAGLKQVGDVSINFGTAMVFYAITESLAKKLKKDQIAGKHPAGGNYFLLNCEGDFGIQIRRLKDRFFQNEDYDNLFKTYIEYPDIDEQIPFSSDTKLNFDSKTELSRFCAGIIKYYLNRFQFHFAQIQDAVQLKNITMSGGMMRSEVWLDILRSHIDQPFTVNNSANAGLIGAVYIYLSKKNGNPLYD
jgi:sugar (pentulose or hexulose) kinase